MDKNAKYQVSLSFEEIKLPPFEDILVVGIKCPYGKMGLVKCMNLLTTDEFEFIETDDEKIAGILINKRILNKIPKEQILSILAKKVFPFISSGELVKVDFKVKVSYEVIDVEGL